MTVALPTRSVTETAARTVLEATGRASGATPFCRDRWYAQMSGRYDDAPYKPREER
jgi:hypothetical protein